MAEGLREQLEQLMVGRLGATQTRRRPRERGRPIEELVGGQVVDTEHGPCIVVEQHHPAGYRHGQVDITAALTHQPRTVAAIGRDQRLDTLEFQRSAFLDVETTGLTGGAGTYAFLVGIGWFEGLDFRLRQVFMRDYSEEPALISLIQDTLGPFSGIISFNGKAFDVPLLESRFIMSRRRFPLSAAPHLDLLHTARRLWRLRLENCRLSTLETEVLGLERHGDVPSEMVPQIYFDYLRYGRAEPLKGVFYHNAQDILSLAALAGLSCSLFDDPLGNEVDFAEDLYSLGRLYTSVGLVDRAESVLRAAAGAHTRDDLRSQAIHHLSLHLKRQERWDEAMELWRLAIEEDHGRLYPYVELAKYYEHRAKDFVKAEGVVLEAIDWVKSASPHRGSWWRDQRLGELEHRLRRVQGKMRRHQKRAG
jgi:uncharacterized protein YprB with RNaseH-like and TPR domain